MVDQSPLLPKSQVKIQATRAQKVRAYILTFQVIACSPLPILTLLPYFHGHTCKGIPSAYAAAIIITVIGFVAVPGKLYNMYKRVKLGELPSGVIELSGQNEDGTLCELYKGQLLLLKFDQALWYLQEALGTFWFFPLAMKNIQYLHDPDADNMVNPEEHCNHTVFTMILAFGCLFFIFTCITVLTLLAVAVGLIKKNPAITEKAPGITDFSAL